MNGLRSPLAHSLILILVVAFAACKDTPPTGTGGGLQLPAAVEVLQIAPVAGDGARIKLDWDAGFEPDAGGEDGFRVFFIPGTDGESESIYDGVDDWFVHDPAGRLGRYRVLAYNDSGEGVSRHIDTELWAWSDPYAVPLVEIHDEPDFGASGIQWAPELYNIGYYQQHMQAAAEQVDFYITNRLVDSGASPHYFASAHRAEFILADSLVVNTVDGLAHTGLIDLGATVPDLLPDPNTAAYVDSAEIVMGHYYGIKTEGDYYGAMRVDGYQAGQDLFAQVRIWMQPIQGLRVFGLLSTPSDP